MRHNFGMARPEGYRKAQRLMDMADRFRLPVVTLVDTPGAYPGVDAEARGQAEAIARSIETCLKIRVPLVAAIIGEGGSGGAIALAAGNRVLMLEHAVYSVISPEGCASILWRSAEQAKEAAEALKLTAEDLLKLGIIDEIVVEPLGGAHRDRAGTIGALGDAIEVALTELCRHDGARLRAERREKFLAMGSEGTELGPDPPIPANVGGAVFAAGCAGARRALPPAHSSCRAHSQCPGARSPEAGQQETRRVRAPAARS